MQRFYNYRLNLVKKKISGENEFPGMQLSPHVHSVTVAAMGLTWEVTATTAQAFGAALQSVPYAKYATSLPQEHSLSPVFGFTPHFLQFSLYLYLRTLHFPWMKYISCHGNGAIGSEDGAE